MASPAPSFKTEFFHDKGWKIVTASGLGVGLGLSPMPFYTIGIFAVHLEREFGWTTDQIMASTFFMMLANLCAGWITGLAADKYGVRKIALLGQIGLTIGMCLLGLVTANLYVQYAAWFFMALLGLGTLPMTWTRGIATWFDKGRGFAFGLALMGTGICGAVYPPLTNWLIETFGWRQAYFGLGLLIPVFAMPLVLLWFREKPIETEDPAQEAVRPDLPGFETKEIIRGYRFWLMLLAFAIISFGVGGLLPNFVRLLISKEIAPSQAAFVASFIGLSVLFGRAFAGYLLDRFWAPIVAVLFLSVPAIGCFILLGETTSMSTAIIAAICLGLSAGAEFDLIAYMCTRYFGLKNYGFVYSLQYASFGFFSGITPGIFGRVFVQTGSYDPILGITAVLFIIGPILLLGLGKYADFEDTQTDH